MADVAISSLPSASAQTFVVTFRAILRLSASFSWGFNLIRVFLVVSVHSINSLLQFIIGRADQLHKVRMSASEEQTINTTPTAITLGGLTGPFSALFIKNLDLVETIEVDSSSSFNQFPQLIPPGRGVFMSPNINTTIYARSTGTSQIQIMVGSS